MNIYSESIYSSSSAVKQTREILNKSIRYLCFIVVVVVHSCHHPLTINNFSSINRYLLAINDSFKMPRIRVLKRTFGPRPTAVILKILAFQISLTWNDVF